MMYVTSLVTASKERQTGAKSCKAGKLNDTDKRALPDWRYKTIAASRDIDNESTSIASVTQRAAQCINMDRDVGRLDKHVRPTRAINSCLVTNSPGRSSKTMSICMARLPRGTGLSPSSCAPHTNAAHFLRQMVGERREGHHVAHAGAEHELLKVENITDGHGMAPDWVIAPASNQCALRRPIRFPSERA
jgi:hypothetical protein